MPEDTPEAIAIKPSGDWNIVLGTYETPDRADRQNSNDYENRDRVERYARTLQSLFWSPHCSFDPLGISVIDRRKVVD